MNCVCLEILLREKRDTPVLEYIKDEDVLLIRSPSGCVCDSAWQYIHIMLLLIAALPVVSNGTHSTYTWSKRTGST